MPTTTRRIRRLSKPLCIALAAGWFSVSCGDSPTRPSQDPVQAPAGTDPVARLTVTIDSLGSREAVAALSNVTLDATGSTGGPTIAIDFGDGTRVTQAVARHVYADAGTYTATVTVTDGSGKTSTASHQVVVASPLGTWLYSGYLTRARRVEVRTLALTAQAGTTVGGFLNVNRERERPVTATLANERTIRIVLDDQTETLEGVLPSVLTGEPGPLELVARGGPADNERLRFQPLRGSPVGPPPDAVFTMRFFSFEAPFAIRNISPIRFDASTSRGEGLTYYMEFGDGQVTTDAVAVHPMDPVGERTARLTVVDRFGRWDSEAQTYEVRTLVAYGYYVWWESPVGTLSFTAQEGTSVAGSGFLYNPGSSVTRFSFTGTVNAEGQVRLRQGSDVELTGTLTLGNTYYSNRMVLTFAGGPRNGQTFTFNFRNGY